ncbi:MAG TPA: hypothetical protein VGL14_04470 [Methylomirabilota bacterium]
MAIPTVLVRAWKAWQRVAHWIGEKQATVVYTVLYFVVIGPIALVRRVFSDPLQLRDRQRASFWMPRAATPVTLDEARRQ